MMQEANTMEAGVASPDATKAVANISTTSYWTEGELIPWKGRWFSIHLNQESKVIELHLKKLTASQEKRDARRVRWLKQHPDAVSGKSSVRG